MGVPVTPHSHSHLALSTFLFFFLNQYFLPMSDTGLFLNCAPDHSLSLFKSPSVTLTTLAQRPQSCVGHRLCVTCLCSFVYLFLSSLLCQHTCVHRQTHTCVDMYTMLSNQTKPAYPLPCLWALEQAAPSAWDIPPLFIEGWVPLSSADVCSQEASVVTMCPSEMSFLTSPWHPSLLPPQFPRCSLVIVFIVSLSH
jgi:hypothetical protein